MKAARDEYFSLRVYFSKSPLKAITENELVNAGHDNVEAVEHLGCKLLNILAKDALDVNENLVFMRSCETYDIPGCSLIIMFVIIRVSQQFFRLTNGCTWKYKASGVWFWLVEYPFFIF